MGPGNRDAESILNRRFDVFLAHTSRDKDIVSGIYHHLTNDFGLDVFFDERTIVPDVPGVDDEMQIAMALKRSSLVLICLADGRAGPYLSIEADDVERRVRKGYGDLVVGLIDGAPMSGLPWYLRRYKPPLEIDSGSPAAAATWLRDKVEDLREKHETIYREKARALGSEDFDKEEQRFRENRVDEMEQLMYQLKAQGVCFVTGPLTGVEVQGGGGLPGPYSMAEAIGAPPEVAGEFNGHRVPLEVIGAWWRASSKGHPGMEAKLKQRLDQCGEHNRNFYGRFADLLRIMTEGLPRGASRSAAKVINPLVFSCNVGVFIEKALIEKGASFYRMVVDLDGGEDQLLVNHVQVTMDGDLRTIRNGAGDLLAEQVPAAEALARFCGSGPDVGIALPADEPPAIDLGDAVILFKYHGSIDVQGSCVIGQDGLFRLARHREAVPEWIRTLLRDRPTVILGSSPLLGPSQQLTQSVLRDCLIGPRMRRLFVPRRSPGPRPDDNVEAAVPDADAWFMQAEGTLLKQRINANDIGNLQLIEGGQFSFIADLRERVMRALQGPDDAP